MRVTTNPVEIDGKGAVKRMTPWFHFVAWSGTGKTTYLEKLIVEFKRRGLRVGVIKHDAHRFTVDREGKDSWRFAQAGADAVAVADQGKWALMDYRPASLERIVGAIQGVDLILVEGWHAEAEKPILLHRAGTGQEPKLPPERCLAVVSDTALSTGGTPLFPLDDPVPLVDFLLKQLHLEKQVEKF